jgi:hypothetical protein
MANMFKKTNLSQPESFELFTFCLKRTKQSPRIRANDSEVFWLSLFGAATMEYLPGRKRIQLEAINEIRTLSVRGNTSRVFYPCPTAIFDTTLFFHY